MDIVKRVDALYEALDNSSLTDKAELKAEVKCCIDAMMHYFSVVSDEKIHFLEILKFSKLFLPNLLIFLRD